MQCVFCGVENPENAAYCISCGKSMKEDIYAKSVSAYNNKIANRLIVYMALALVLSPLAASLVFIAGDTRQNVQEQGSGDIIRVE